MKKSILAVLLTAVMVSGIVAGCGGADSSAAAASSAAEAASSAVEEAAEAAEAVTPDFGDLEGEYDPEAGYDEYTLTEYTIEDAGATFVATVSRKADKSAYYVHCNFYGDEQAVELDGDLNVLSDKTGFMETDSPLIVQQAESENNWYAIP